MPELPEVETVRRTLAEVLVGHQITDVTVCQAVVVKTPDCGEFSRRLMGQRFREIQRRGKYLQLFLSGGDCLVVHLRMTGKLVYTPAGEPLPKHTHLYFQLDNGYQLRYTDQRRFGRLWLVPAGEMAGVSGLSSLGPEPLGPEFCRDLLASRLNKKKTKIKAFLLDQRQIAGIGNIYADEILHAAGIHPERPAGSLAVEEISSLYQAVRDVLQLAVERRGTSFSDYVDGRGEKGSNQDFLQVYQLTGQSCQRCGATLCQVKVAGRSSHYCPGCQR